MDDVKHILPVHLEDQMVYEFSKAVEDAKEILEQKFDRVRLRPGYEASFRRDFGSLRADILPVMKSRNLKGLDPHKLAAIACLTVLIVRPLHIPQNGEGHSVNEVVAFLLAVKIIRNYQVARAVPDKRKQKKLHSMLGSLETPDLIYDTQPVPVNTILAFRQLSRTLCQSKHPIDSALVLSSLFFFIDAHSYAAVESIANTI
ncbi:MAG: hypothetical protein FWH06_02575 [Oscillospiraceae bacterium]|nr:hypothetical protein [Oscillospiraceae bacterium]